MGHLKIHCGGCGSDWIIYHRDDWKEWKARTCPTCGESIDQGTWERSVLMGFGGMEDANLELMKDYEQYHKSFFSVEYIPDVVYPNEGKMTEINQLREDIKGLRSIITELFQV